MTLLKICLIGLFVSIATLLTAQVYVGFRGGLSRANMTYESFTERDTDPMNGVTFGIGAETDLAGGVSMQLDAMIAAKGAVIISNDGVRKREEELSITHVEFPLAFKYNFGNKKQGGFAGGGIGAGYAIGGSITLDNNQTADLDFAEIGYERLESFYFGTVGFYTNTPSGKMMVDLRYQGSLSNQATNDNFTFLNRQILITVGYFFKLG